jgi:glycosyltransferase involved in cell wall biosynthesis
VRVLLASGHRYPGVRGGLSSWRIHDWLAKGLAELGHEVFYLLEKGASEPLPPGVVLVTGPVCDAEIGHNVSLTGKRWVRTCHVDVQGSLSPQDRSVARDNWIFVSRSLARTYGRERFVLNGIDPGEYVYSEDKEDYCLFLSNMVWGRRKGVDLAVELAVGMGFELVVAGAHGDDATLMEIRSLCDHTNVRYVGDVQGREKAVLLARARALLFPTRLNEAFGLVMAEALMSGTPVICSDNGACPELISPDVGFVCRTVPEYTAAIEAAGRISPRACREKAMQQFHYLRMARDYVREYEKEIGGGEAARCGAEAPA